MDTNEPSRTALRLEQELQRQTDEASRRDATLRGVLAVNPRRGPDIVPEASRIAAGTPQPVKEAGFLEVTQTYLRDPRTMSWSFIDKIANLGDDGGDAESIRAGWSYAAVMDEAEKGKTWEQVQFLRENGVKGRASFDRAIGRLEYDKDSDSVYARASGPVNFLAQMTAGMADPTALLLGAGIAGVASRGLGIGAGALVRAGRPVAAVGAAVGENVAGELAFTALQDLSGEVLGFEDYAMATAGAAVLGGMFSYGTYRKAAEQASFNVARDMADNARRAAEEAMRRDGVDGDNAAHVAQWREEQARKVQAELKKVTDVGIMPEDLTKKLTDLADGTAEETVEVTQPDGTVVDTPISDVQGPDGKPPEPEPVVPEPWDTPGPDDVPEPLTPERVLGGAQALIDVGDYDGAANLLTAYIDSADFHNLLDQTRRAVQDLRQDAFGKLLRERERVAFEEAAQRGGSESAGLDPLAYSKVTTQDGRAVGSGKVYARRAAKQKAGKGNWRDTSVNELLDAAMDSQNPAFAWLKPMLIHARAWSEKAGAPKLVTLAQLPPGSSPWASPGGEMVLDVGPGAGSSTVREIADSMTPWQASTLVHETVHAMTQHVIGAWLRGDPLPAEMRGAVAAIDEVFQRYVTALGPMDQAPSALRYSMNNLDEFVAESQSNPEVIKYLANMPAHPKWGGKYSNALSTVIQAIKKALAVGLDRNDTAYDQVMAAVDVLYRARDSIEATTVSTKPGRSLPLPANTYDKTMPLWDNAMWRAARNLEFAKNPGVLARWRKYTDGEVSTKATADAESKVPGLRVTDSAKADARMSEVVSAIQGLVSKYLPDQAVYLTNLHVVDNPNSNGSISTYKSLHMIAIHMDRIAARFGGSYAAQAIRAGVHEVGHAVFHSYAKDIPAPLLARMKDDFAAYMQDVYAGKLEARAKRYSASNPNRDSTAPIKSSEYAMSFDEYTAEQFVKYVERQAVARGDRGLTGTARALLAGLVNRLLGLFTDARLAGHLEPDASFAEFFENVYDGVYRNTVAALPPSVQPGAVKIDPIATVDARRKFAQRQYEHARALLQAFPIDRERLRVLTAKMGGALSDGLVLARSQNPILNSVAMFITETTTGAAGRRGTVALRKHALQGNLIGNSRLDFETAYLDWRNRNGGGTYDDLVKGTVRTKFDRAVYEEILNRRMSREWRSSDPAIAKAADAAEALFERSLKAQKEAGTLGSDRLPETSRGYVPQKLDGRKLAQMTTQDLAELEEHLAAHWVTALDWDAAFSQRFARFYTQRARDRTMNPNSKDFSGSTPEGAGLIRESLEEMMSGSRDPDLIEQARKSLKGLGQTKRRLDVDLLGTLPSGKRVLDFYEDDTSALMLRYVNRTAGTVALTEFGIPGLDGVKHLRDAATLYSEDPAEIPTQQEMEAFDRVMAEVLGAPVPGQVHSTNATSVRLLVMLQRLGGMAWTQAAEGVQVVHHLGLASALKNIAGLPKALAEVGRIKKGLPTQDRLLTHVEQWGGEFGSMAYKMNFPLDPPDDRLHTYVDDPGVLHRLLSAGAYYQSKLSGFRAMHAAQHRLVAEQIVMKAARYIQEGGEQKDRWLADMGFTPELIGAVRAHIDDVAKWDGNGHMTQFDINQIPDNRARIEVAQAVHRGVSQIIQGTFIGERNAWVHNDYVSILTQLRTFGLTSMEKQWGRVREVTGGGKEGYATAAALLMAQMALVLPIYAARVHFNSLGREDREEFVEKNLSPANLLRGVMNYTSLSGMLGDVLDVTTGLAGGWGGDNVAEAVGGRQGQGAGRITDAIPAVGSADAASRVVTGNATVYQALKQLPGSNLPFIIPIINLTK